MKLTAKAPKKAPKKSAAALPKLPIMDACAAYLCEQPPAKGSSYCAEHGAGPRSKVKAAKPAELSAADQSLWAQMVSSLANRPGIPPVKAKAEKPAKPSKGGEKAERAEAESIINALRAIGWTDGKIGEAMGVNPSSLRSTVWGWRMQKTTCPNMDGLRALALIDAPQKGEKPAPKAKAKRKAKAEREPTVSGSLKAPQESKAARMNRPLPDARQLVLQLKFVRDAIDQILEGKV